MKHRVLFIAFMIVALAAFYSVPKANAEPLTIMAIHLPQIKAPIMRKRTG